MVSRNRDSVSFALGIAASIIGFLALIFTCVGVGLPSWYVGTDANNTVALSYANLFYTCVTTNSTSGVVPPGYTCTSYSSFSCSTTSYVQTRFNITAIGPGCINPDNNSLLYANLTEPIYQVSTDNFYRLRGASALAITGILFIFFSTISVLFTSIFLLNIYLLLIAPVLACLAVLFSACAIAVSSAVFRASGVGFALFITGLALTLIITVLTGISAGRLNAIETLNHDNEDEALFTRQAQSPHVRRQVIKRRP